MDCLSCCYWRQRMRVWFLRLRGAERRGDFWFLGSVALLDPEKLR